MSDECQEDGLKVEVEDLTGAKPRPSSQSWVFDTNERVYGLPSRFQGDLRWWNAECCATNSASTAALEFIRKGCVAVTLEVGKERVERKASEDVGCSKDRRTKE